MLNYHVSEGSAANVVPDYSDTFAHVLRRTY